jgi:hypothetical protein
MATGALGSQRHAIAGANGHVAFRAYDDRLLLRTDCQIGLHAQTLDDDDLGRKITQPLGCELQMFRPNAELRLALLHGAIGV